MYVILFFTVYNFDTSEKVLKSMYIHVYVKAYKSSAHSMHCSPTIKK